MNHDKRLEIAQMRVLFTVPFFAPGVCRLPIIWDDTIPTACTNGKHILWNPEWFDSLEDQELVTVLCEEVGHCLLGHLWRTPLGANPTTWNIACDSAVRHMMAEFGESVKSRKLADPFPFPDPENSLPDPRFKNMSEEEIYAILNRPQPNQKPKSGVSGKSGGGGAPPASQQPGKQPGQTSGGKPTGSPTGQPDASAGRSQFAEFEVQTSQPSSAKDKNQWEGVLIQSAAACKGRGDLPGSLQRFIQETLSPQVPWWEIVRNWLREQVNDDWNWMKPNPYYDESPFILPSLDSERIGEIVFATDTSGSIDNKTLAQFITEKQNCLDEMKPRKLLDLCCDTRITKEREYRPGDTIDPECPGGGGTSFIPVFNAVDKLPNPPKCLVYLTDLDGSFPKEEPSYPVLWVTWEKDGTAPFGEIVRV